MTEYLRLYIVYRRCTVCQHLKILKEPGLVQVEVDGLKVCYCISLEKLAASKSLVASLWLFFATQHRRSSIYDILFKNEWSRT